jgi:short-subunit dehydrogenase
MDLAGKVVLITGASEGIGAACAAEFRKRGAHLSITARSEEKMRSASPGDTLITPGDITDPEVRLRIVENTIERFGKIDVLVNNAGKGLYTPAWRAPMNEVRDLFELNFFVPLAMVQLVAPHMRERHSGMIVNVSSIAGKVTLPWLTVYCTSKYALGSLTDGLRMELGHYGIHTMTVCPGYVKTDFQRHAAGEPVPDKVIKGRQFAITPQRCAKDIADGVERGKRTVVTPSVGWIFIGLERLLPSVVDGRMAAMSRAEHSSV